MAGYTVNVSLAGNKPQPTTNWSESGRHSGTYDLRPHFICGHNLMHQYSLLH